MPAAIAAFGSAPSSAEYNLLPRGYIVATSITGSGATGVSTVATDVTGLSVTWTALANRRYRITAGGDFAFTATDTQAFLILADGASTQIQRTTSPVTSNTAIPVSGYLTYIEAPSAGSTTRKLMIQRATGSGTVGFQGGTGNPAFIVVEDIGRT